MRVIIVILAILNCSFSVAMEEPAANQALNDVFRHIQRNNYHDLNEILQIAITDNVHISLLRSYDKRGLTPLQAALCSEHISLEIIGLLLKSGSNPNQRIFKKPLDEKIVFFKGCTAAHIAISRYANREILSLLQKHGTDFLKPDGQGFTAVILANKYDHWAAKKFFHTIYGSNSNKPRLNFTTHHNKSTSTHASKDFEIVKTREAENPTAIISAKTLKDLDSDESDYDSLWSSIVSSRYGALNTDPIE